MLWSRLLIAAVVVAATVATEVAAWRTWFLRPSLVDHNCAAVHLTVLRLVDRLFGGLVVVEFDKPKAFGAVGVAVDDDLS